MALAGGGIGEEDAVSRRLPAGILHPQSKAMLGSQGNDRPVPTIQALHARVRDLTERADKTRDRLNERLDYLLHEQHGVQGTADISQAAKPEGGLPGLFTLLENLEVVLRELDEQASRLTAL